MKRFLFAAALSLFAFSASAQTAALSDDDYDTVFVNTHGFAHSCHDAVNDLRSETTEEKIETADTVCAAFVAGSYLLTHTEDGVARLDRYIKEEPEERLKAAKEFYIVGREVSVLARVYGPARLPRLAAIAEYLSGLESQPEVDAEEYL